MDATGAVIATNSFTSNGLVSRRNGTVDEFYSFDPEGNVAQRTDDNGSVLNNPVFSVHGTPLGGTALDVFGYRAQSGYMSDTETGLQLLTERYYDSSDGRFLTRDPIGYGGGINLYGYVANNPENTVDPNGLAPKDKWYGYNNRDFQRWFHLCWKEKGDPDATKEEMAEAYQEWVNRGKPTGGNCYGGKPQPEACRDLMPESARRRTMQPGADELRMYSESNRHRETVWKTVAVGGAAVVVVIAAPEAAAAALIRGLIRAAPALRAVPVR